jgi:hypothetical protein
LGQFILKHTILAERGAARHSHWYPIMTQPHYIVVGREAARFHIPKTGHLFNKWVSSQKASQLQTPLSLRCIAEDDVTRFKLAVKQLFLSTIQTPYKRLWLVVAVTYSAKCDVPCSISLRYGVVSLNIQAGGSPLVGCPCPFIYHSRSYPPYLEAASSIRNLRTCRAVAAPNSRRCSIKNLTVIGPVSS